MTERVLFLALGASRRRAVLGETADAVARGHEVLVLVESLTPWQRRGAPERGAPDGPFAPGVRVVELTRLESRHLPRRLAWLLLFGGPRSAVALLARGPLRSPVTRAGRRFERTVARPVHHRLFLPAHRRVFGDSERLRAALLRRLVRERRVGHLVVTDPASLPAALCLTRGPDAPALSYDAFRPEDVPEPAAAP